MSFESGPPYTAKAVANYFLGYRLEDEDVHIDPMKLQKLIYYAHGWHLAITGKPLIDEPVEAWQYGPVVPSIYHEFKHWGPDPIGREDFARDFDGRRFVEPKVRPSDHQTLEILDRVWQQYGDFSGIQLSNMTHQQGSPWDETWAKAQKAGKAKGVDIDDDLIEDHFRRQALAGRRRARGAGA